MGVPGDLLDLILIALIAAFAVAGYRQGFIIGVLSLVGFVVGVAAGAYIAPGISRLFAKSLQWQAFIAIVVVFSIAVLGMLIASGLGVALRSRLIGRPATVVDSLGGAVVNVVAVLLVTWLLGSFVSNSPFPTVSSQVQDSVVLRTVDGLMPSNTLTLPFFPGIKRLMTSGFYTQVFSAMGAESSLRLPQPSASIVNAQAVRHDDASIVKIQGVAPSCSLKIEGSGFVIARQYVLTNAHVVAGVTEAPRVITPSGVQHDATVVLYDPQTDVAILHVPTLDAPPLKWAAAPASFGADAVVVGYPLNHSLTAVPARVGRAINAYGPDIYQNHNVNRRIYPIESSVKPGNSGGPLLATNGKVYGVVFAASIQNPSTGYALTADEVHSDVTQGEHRSAPQSTQTCQQGG